MGEAHKPTCSRRGSKGLVRREGATGKRPATPAEFGGHADSAGRPRHRPGPERASDTKLASNLRGGSVQGAAAQPPAGHVADTVPAVEVADPAPRARASNVWLQEESQS